MTDRHASPPIPVAICESQPLTATGACAALAVDGNFCVVLQTSSLDELRLRASASQPRVAILDKSAGLENLPHWIAEAGEDTFTVVWGSAISEAETVRLLHAGVRGVLRKTATAEMLVACLRTVDSGQRWMEEGVLRDNVRMERRRSELTPREQQVMGLVEIGLRNRDIARELGIRPGTVKIHLKHIFEKTGIRGRYGLALSGLQDRGVLKVNGSVRDFAVTTGD